MMIMTQRWEERDYFLPPLDFSLPSLSWFHLFVQLKESNSLDACGAHISRAPA